MKDTEYNIKGARDSRKGALEVTEILVYSIKVKAVVAQGTTDA